MPRFSVIVPIYNVDAYLHQCIESILSQSYENFELILVDDGSPDSCPAICDEYAEKDNRIRVIHKENGGLVSARIAGAKEAASDYVCCVDGDDWVHPDYLKKLADAITEKEPDVICFGFFTACDGGVFPKKLSIAGGCYDKERIKQTFFPLLIENENAKYFPVSICYKAYKRTLYLQQQCAVNPKLKIAEDAACTLPVIYRADSICILEDCLYYYRQNPSSMTKEKKPFDWNGPKLLFEHLCKQIDLAEGDFREQLYRRTAHGVFTVAVSQFYKKESYFAICRDVKSHLKEPVYAEAIKKAKYKVLSGRMAVFALRYKQMWLMKLWSHINKK